ncbi:MAG TPA: hypothetical protein VJT75_13825 [Thermoleophilaceae bacterium]|nr:hypothetical protein [Thermoleophilaceae bacterium]
MAKEIASILLRNRLGALTADGPRCSHCSRSPLVGERIHELGSGKRVCSLCVTLVSATEGEPVGSELVRSGERPLAVVQPRAA